MLTSTINELFIVNGIKLSVIYYRAQRRKMLQELKEEEDGRAKKPKVESFEDMQLQEDVKESYEEVTMSQYRISLYVPF